MSEKKVKEKKEKTKMNPMILMMAVVLILMVLLGSGLAYVIVTQNKPAVVKIVEVSNLPELPKYTHLIEKDFLVNLTDTDAKHYIKLNISLGFDSVKLEEEFKVSDSFVRDIVISILSEKKSTDFTGHGKEELKKEIMTRINQYLKDGKVSEIYFNDILVQ